MIHPCRIALAIAALTTVSPTVAKDKKPVDPDKKICRSEMPTGSRMTKSICHNAAEWAQIDATNTASAQSIQDQASRSSPQ